MVWQYKALWNIPAAGPSVSTFHLEDDSGAITPSVATTIRGFFAELVNLLPNEVSIQFDSEIARLDTVTGQLIGTQAVTPPTAVSGAGTGTWAAGSGARVVWNTGAIADGRRVRGATFLVPLVLNAFSTSGVVTGSAITDVNDAAATMLSGLTSAGNGLVVYSRPRPGVPGAEHLVDSAGTSATAATLRGRKY